MKAPSAEIYGKSKRKVHNVEEYGSIYIRLAVVASQICEIPRNSPKIRTYSSSRSSKVIDLGANRKLTCNYLLVIICVTGDTSFLLEPRVTFWLFFWPIPGGQTPQPIFTQNGSDDVDMRKDVPFAVRIATFHTHWSPGPPKGQNVANFWTSISLDLAFNIRGPETEHPLFFIAAQWKWHSE